MKKPIKTFDRYDVVLVPFPFIDQVNAKRRPALVLSSSKNFNIQSGGYALAMITTATHSPWPLDIEINDLESAGLPLKSIVRMKLFTLDHRLILKYLGTLSKKDQKNVSENIKALFGF